MEIGGNMNMNMNILGHDHNNHSHISSSRSRGQNGNNNTYLTNWDIWGCSTSAAATDNSSFYSPPAVTMAATAEASSSTTCSEASTAGHAFIMGHPLQQQQSSFYGGGSRSHYHPDPHLMCLKLGKRHYFEDHALDDRHVAGLQMGVMSKRGRGGADAAAAAAHQLYGSGATLALKVMPRCQVEGCHVALMNAKEYHRRHKVCEMHSKASKVTVLGQEQRFCQQCSRFHVVSEFDESKRSCRRRLAGHNERRRKSSHDSLSRTSSHQENGRFGYLSTPTGRALSLLSSRNTGFDSGVSPSDLSSRSSAALRELIAENRAAVLARQLINSSEDRNWDLSSHNNHATEDLFCDHGQSWSNSVEPQQHQMFSDHNYQHQHGFDRFHEGSGAHLTLDLRQAPSPACGFLPERGKTKAEEDQECDLWNSFHGASVV